MQARTDASIVSRTDAKVAECVQHLDIQVFPRPEVHDVDIEIIVTSLRQELAQGEDLRGHVQYRLLTGTPYLDLCFPALCQPASDCIPKQHSIEHVGCALILTAAERILSVLQVR